MLVKNATYMYILRRHTRSEYFTHTTGYVANPLCIRAPDPDHHPVCMCVRRVCVSVPLRGSPADLFNLVPKGRRERVRFYYSLSRGFASDYFCGSESTLTSAASLLFTNVIS